MVDEVREKPPGSHGRPLPQGRSGGIGTFQSEGESCCRFAAGAAGLSFSGQPQVAGAWVAVVMQHFPTEPVGGLKTHGTRRRGGRTI